MTDLITRLSKLDAPDREVDAEIWLIELQSAESDPFGGYGLAEDWGYEYEAEEDGSVIQYARNGQVTHKIGRRSSPAFTASIDAAIALAERVLPGWGWEIASNTNHIKNCLNPEYGKPIGKHPHWAVVANQSSRKFVDGATPAIALCIAILRAKEASNAE